MFASGLDDSAPHKRFTRCHYARITRLPEAFSTVRRTRLRVLKEVPVFRKEVPLMRMCSCRITARSKFLCSPLRATSVFSPSGSKFHMYHGARYTQVFSVLDRNFVCKTARLASVFSASLPASLGCDGSAFLAAQAGWPTLRLQSRPFTVDTFGR
jgi:hypothetical protein